MAAKLNDTQRIILATAAARDTHNILPLPEGLRAPPVAVQRTLRALIAAGFVAETDEGSARITPAGLAAMGITEPDEAGNQDASDQAGSGNVPEAGIGAAIAVAAPPESGAAAGSATGTASAAQADEGPETNAFAEDEGGSNRTSSPESGTAGEAEDEAAASSEPGKRLSKSRAVVEMLRRQSGASIAEISEVTGWQAHSVRGF
jgi:predicted transcriptional regulator